MISEDLEQRLIALAGAGSGIWQNKFHDFDVYDHTLECVRYLKEMTDDPEMIAAGYLHDIAKPRVRDLLRIDGATQEKEPGVAYHTFYNHEEVGRNMVWHLHPDFFEGLNQGRIAGLVGSHYVPMKGIKMMRHMRDWEDFSAAYELLEETLDHTGLPREDVLMLFIADAKAHGTGCTDLPELELVRDALLGKAEPREVYNLQKQMYENKE